MVKEEQPALHEELEKLRIEIVEHGPTTWKNVSVQLRSRVQRSKSCGN
jgi:hypothetical protein